MRARTIGLALMLTLVSCGEPQDASSGARPAPPTDTHLDDAELLLLFDDVAVPGDVVPAVHNEGQTDVQLQVVTTGGGRLTWIEGTGSGMAVRTPAYQADGPVPGAALVATIEGTDSDPLSPGHRDFRLAVDLEADPPQAGRAGDDGDNLVQRGRYGEGLAQYKLQLDNGIPSCRIAGSEGEAELAGHEPLRSGRWYRVTCTRTADEVRLVVIDLGADARQVVEEVAAVDVGDVALDGIPLSVGAKVDDEGRLDLAGLDQFHGVIDRVVIDVS